MPPMLGSGHHGFLLEVEVKVEEEEWGAWGAC
jgi:hypothetical protein